MNEAREALTRVFGFTEFRPGQQETLEAVFAGENVLAVMSYPIAARLSSDHFRVAWRRAVRVSARRRGHQLGVGASAADDPRGIRRVRARGDFETDHVRREARQERGKAVGGQETRAALQADSGEKLKALRGLLGAGTKKAAIARALGISEATVYQAMKLLKPE